VSYLTVLSLTFVRQSHFSATVWTGHYDVAGQTPDVSFILDNFSCN